MLSSPPAAVALALALTSRQGPWARAAHTQGCSACCLERDVLQCCFPLSVTVWSASWKSILNVLFCFCRFTVELCVSVWHLPLVMNPPSLWASVPAAVSGRAFTAATDTASSYMELESLKRHVFSRLVNFQYGLFYAFNNLSDKVGMFIVDYIMVLR